MKKLLVIVLAVTLILPLIWLPGCITPPPTATTPSKTLPPITGLPPTTIPPSITVTPSPTPTMLQLAFAGNRNGKYALFVINIDGSGEKQLTSWPEDNYDHPSWSPDGTMLATQRGTAGIATINLNNGTRKDLGNVGTNPDFSPYGNLIISVFPFAFAGFNTVNLGGAMSSISISQPGKLGNDDMYLDVVAGSVYASLGNPSVSPDASKIAFEASGVRVAPPKPSPTPTITPTPTTGRGGTGVATGDRGPQGTPEPGKRILLVDFEGTKLKQLTTSKEKYDDTYPAWSPDGKRIAFVSNRTGKNQIYVMNADGTGQTQITSDAFNNHDPAWSPDGAYIAYVADHSGISELVIIRPDGTGRTRLNKVAEMVRAPAWRPLPGKGLGVPPIIPAPPPPPPVTTKPPVTTTSPQPPAPTTGGLFISIGGTNSPYSIYVNGALVGKDWASLTLVPGSYSVTIYNRNGRVVHDTMSTVIAGKTSEVKVSGAG